jgi:hypothetical protein
MPDLSSPFRAQTGRKFGRKVWRALSLHEEWNGTGDDWSHRAGVVFGGKLI